MSDKRSELLSASAPQNLHPFRTTTAEGGPGRQTVVRRAVITNDYASESFCDLGRWKLIVLDSEFRGKIRSCILADGTFPHGPSSVAKDRLLESTVLSHKIKDKVFRGGVKNDSVYVKIGAQTQVHSKMVVSAKNWKFRFVYVLPIFNHLRRTELFKHVLRHFCLVVEMGQVHKGRRDRLWLINRVRTARAKRRKKGVLAWCDTHGSIEMKRINCVSALFQWTWTDKMHINNGDEHWSI